MTAIADTIYKAAVESAMSWTSRGNVMIRLSGSSLGFPFAQWEALIEESGRDCLFSLPRCMRLRAWNADDRLKQIADTIEIRNLVAEIKLEDLK